ncbi:glycosyltransferase family 2 protein [Microbacterium hydrocarbonoxydans]|uniref:glycosyltransferase family 2 protein n=1 Tax=Microbacterium hydrocarbonoxydans TaxID=273678 RepID=UPI00203C7019|nr:glycosyltransferase [Microbacterium hydrocarbonoxydans]MCM3778317.1 glycosyltransferase [Microbacterium hydrocarbonoxydans]
MTASWVVGNGWDAVDGVVPEPLPRVSVIISHYDQRGELARTLQALAAQDYPRELLEIVVADDGSPGDVDVPDGVTLVRQEDRGFRLAAVRNLGVRASSGDVLCFLDADTSPEPGYVRALTRLPALLPEAVVVGRRRHADFTGIAPDTPVVKAAAGRELAEPGWLAEEYARSRDLLDADDRSYRFVIGAVMGCSRRMFDEVGGFDETFTTYGGEDWEWAHRMWQAGAVLAHVPDAVAWHDGPEWADRDGSGMDRANAQTLRLQSSIPVPGSAPRALWPGDADLVVRLPGEHSAAALFITADSLFAAFPRARLVVEQVPAELVEDPRVTVSAGDVDARVVWEMPRPVVVLDPAWVVDLVTRLGSGRVGSVDLLDEDGSSLGSLRSRRATRRAARWGAEGGFETEKMPVDGILALRPDPRVEAWLGGWGGVESFC